MKRVAILALSISLGLAACSKKEEPVIQTGQFQNHARVLQVVQGGGYTYMEAMGETGEKIWMAGAPVEAKAGDSVSFGQYNVMQNFQSKALNRTFDKIVFVEAWAVGGKAAKVGQHGTMPPGGAAGGMAGGLPAGHPPMAGAPAGHPPMGNAPAGAPAGGGNSGVVKTASNAGGYSYVEVQQGSGTIWIAAPETQVKVGDKVSWEGGAVMQNFSARSLNRTFDQITFAGSLSVVK